MHPSAFRRSNARSMTPLDSSRPEGIFRPRGCSRRTSAGSSPGTRRVSPCCGGRRIPERCSTPSEFRCTRSLAKTLRNRGFELAIDRDFRAVIEGCAAPRASSLGTWITAEMRTAYLELHRHGYAHSVETYLEGQLAGGLYGVRLGGIFFGESMFSRERDASKAALARLVQYALDEGIAVIDCQLPSRHLQSLGSRTIARSHFQDLLRQHVGSR